MINQLLIDTLIEKHGPQVRRRDIKTTAMELNVEYRPLLLRRDIICGRGTYDLNKITGLKPQPTKIELTEEEINQKMKDRFNALTTMTKAAAKGTTKAFIISGPGGLGKTFEVLKALTEVVPEFNDIRDKVSGFTRASGLYKALWEHSQPGQVLVLDDVDQIFQDEVCLNLLKAVCDTTERRTVSWRAETRMQDETGEQVPTYFEFRGTIIFITNKDLRSMSMKDDRLSTHIQALLTRAHYLDLEIKTKREYLARIKQVIKYILADMSEDGRNEILNFMIDNVEKYRIDDLNLRTVIKLAQLREIGTDWKNLANTLE